MCITYLIKYLLKTSDYYSSKINPVKLKNYNCFWKMHGDKESLFDYWIGEKVILILKKASNRSYIIFVIKSFYSSILCLQNILFLSEFKNKCKLNI